MGDAEGLRATAKAAEAAGKMNVAMTSYFLLQDLDAVLKLLPQQASRIPALAKLAKFAGFAKLLQNCCKFLADSFSLVSKRNFARKYAYDSIFKFYKICILLHRRNLKVLEKKSVWKNQQYS